MTMAEPKRCDYHAKLVADQGGERTVETVDGPLSQLKEWGRSFGSYGDGCDGAE